MAGDEFGRDSPIWTDLRQGWIALKSSNNCSLVTKEFDVLGITQDSAADLVIIALHGDLAKVPPLSERQLATVDLSGFLTPTCSCSFAAQ